MNWLGYLGAGWLAIAAGTEFGGGWTWFAAAAAFFGASLWAHMET